MCARGVHACDDRHFVADVVDDRIDDVRSLFGLEHRKLAVRSVTSALHDSCAGHNPDQLRGTQSDSRLAAALARAVEVPADSHRSSPCAGYDILVGLVVWDVSAVLTDLTPLGLRDDSPAPWAVECNFHSRRVMARSGDIYTFLGL